MSKFIKAMKKTVAIFMTTILALSTVPFASLVTANAAEVSPNDTVTLVKVADGTHAGAGTETFINSKNGFAVADDTETDGVVASGDYVTYEYDLSIVAGRARTVNVKFTQPDGGALNIADFGNVAMTSSTIIGKFSGDTWTYEVPRGASAHIKARFSVRAKDTKGSVVKDNVITATLTNNIVSSYEYTTKTDPVTVVSTPFADLTIDSVYSRNAIRNYSQGAKYGTFNIEPAVLKIDGYSDNGLSSGGEWHTDIDVSSFPDGTQWWLGDTELTTTNGKIKDVKASGNQTLKYKLPDSAIPTAEDPKAIYTIYLEPYADSFKTGDVSNIKDPGAGEGEDYDTSTYTSNGALVHAPKGVNVPNNNYATAVWRYEPPVEGKIWRYDTYVPRNDKETVYDNGNIYWNNKSNYYQQGSKTYYEPENLKYITNDNDMYGVITISSDGLKGVISTDKLVAGDTWDSEGTEGNYRDSHYDTTRNVVVTYNGDPIDVDNYTVQWRTVPKGVTSLDDGVTGASEWITSNKAPNTTVNQCRVIFKKDAFNNTTGITKVYIPAKARNDYNPLTDSHKLINAKGTFAINKEDTANGVTGNKYSTVMSYNEVLSFPSVPSVRADIANNKDKPKADDEGKYTAEFVIRDRVDGAPTAYGYSATRTLTFDSAYDTSTFKLTYYYGWKVDSITGNTVVLKKDNFNLDQGDGLGDTVFTIQTKMNINQRNKEFVEGTVREDLSLTYPKVGNIESGTLTSDDSSSYKFDAMREVSSILTADTHKVEVGDSIGFTLNVSADNKGFSQDVVLPYNKDDKAIIPIINGNNHSNIDIDEDTGKDKNGEMDGIGRTKADGRYKVESITLIKYADDTTVEYRKPDGSKVKLPVNYETGEVDISSIPECDLTNPAALVFSSNKTMSDVQGTGVKAHISIKPTDNKVGNDYVTWVGRTREYNKETGNPLNDNSALAKEMSWPDYTSVVASSVTGIVWQDDNSDGKVDAGEKRYSGVHVKLQKFDGSNYVDTGLETTTDSNGVYKFENLHSGKYRVVLPNVEREAGSDKVSQVSGGTGESAKDGDLKQANVNRFNVTEPTIQTYSYGAYKKYSSTTTYINLGVGEDKADINYGFKENIANLSLDKSAASVTDNGDGTSTVEWDVTVKNNGNEDIEGAVLTDRTSNDVVGVDSTLGYLKETEDDIPGEIKTTVENNGATVYTSKDYGVEYKQEYSMLCTSEGNFIIDNRSRKIKKFELPNGETISKIHIPEDDDYSLYNNYSPFVVETSEGKVYVVNPVTLESKEITEGSYANYINYRKMYLINNTEGSIIVKDLYNGSLLSKYNLGSSNINSVKFDNNRRSGSNNNNFVALINGNTLFYSYENTFFPTLNQNRYYNIGEGNTKLLDIKDIGNDVLAVTNKGLFVLTAQKDADGVHYKFRKLLDTDKAIGFLRGLNKLALITEDSIIEIDVYNNYNTRVIASGLSEVKQSNTSNYRDQVAFKQTGTDGIEHICVAYYSGGFNEEISINTIAASGTIKNIHYKGFTILETSDGVYTNSNATFNKQDISGKIMSFGGENFIVTDKGIFTRSFVGGNLKYVKILFKYTKFYKDQSISPASQTVGDNNTTRTYNLPKIIRGNTTTLHIKGTVLNDNVEKIVGNQAFVTSPLTPREGIEQHDPSVKTTGNNQKPGVPDEFTLPNKDNFDKDGIHGTPTVKLNKDIDHDETPVDDLADQTPALIPKNKTGEKLDNTYILNGFAWYDLNKNGLRDDNSPVVGVRVTVTDKNNPNVSYDTVTDSNGHWQIEHLYNNTNYEVHYDVVGHEHDGKIWSATIHNDSDNKMNSDIDKAGYVNSDTVVAIKTGESGEADAGLVAVDADITITKGHVKDTDEVSDDDTVYGDKELVDDTKAVDVDPSGYGEPTTSRVDDKDGDIRTQAYSYNIVNNGQSDLTDVKIYDETTEGNAAKIGTKLTYYPDGQTPDINNVYQIDSNGYVVDSNGNMLVMAPGSKLIGAFDVPFTTGNDVHKDTITTTANVLSEGTVVGSVTDKDNMKTKYVYRPSRTINVHKVGDDTDGEKNLSGVSFKIERLIGENEYKNLGEYVTDENGNLDVNLDAGTYRITETKTADGYRLPDSSWNLELAYNSNGDPVAKITGEGVPLATIDGQSDAGNIWCNITIHNKRVPSVFQTGSSEGFIIMLAALIVLGISARTIRKKKLA